MKRVALDALIRERDPSRKAALLQCLAQECRIDLFDVLHGSQTGHWGGAASCAELLCTLYFHIMNVRPDEPNWPERDRLVLSKGHASGMLYAVLGARGYFPRDELGSFRTLGSRLQGHPCMRKTPGVDMSTGALGHGISITLGMALGSRLQRRDFWSFVIAGEGCLNEGQSWEALMAAAKFRPPRLVLMVDYNKVQLDGPSDEIMPLDPLGEKLAAFGWQVLPRYYDGNSARELLESWGEIQERAAAPVAVIYRTRKGRGVSFMEDQAKWHSSPIDPDSYERGRAELQSTLGELWEAL